MHDHLTAEQRELYDRAFAAGAEFRDQIAAWDAADDAPYHEITARMGELGFFGLCIPAEYGGQDGTAVEYLIATAGVFRGSQSWMPGEPLFCTSGPGPAMLLLAEEHLRSRYLPEIVAGRMGCAIALTESLHGSDLTHLETTAEADGSDFVINGEKAFVTGATHNELYAVFTRFDGVSGAKGIGAMVVEADRSGLHVLPGPEFVGLRGFRHGNLELSDVRVPKENLIVGPGQFSRLMSAFNLERLHNVSFSLGMAEAAFDEAAAYTQEREAFGRPIIEFQATYHALADMWTTIEAQRALALNAARNAIDGRFPRVKDVSIAKLFGSTALPQVTLKAMELFGGKGVTKSSVIERIHRDAVSAVVAGGSPPVLRNAIASQLFPDLRFSQTRD